MLIHLSLGAQLQCQATAQAQWRVQAAKQQSEHARPRQRMARRANRRIESSKKRQHGQHALAHGAATNRRAHSVQDKGLPQTDAEQEEDEHSHQNAS